MADAKSDLRWGVERRLEFIEFRLYWEGGINRADITGFFGVSVPQASKDLSHYQDLAPGNMTYDKSEKRYFVSGTFTPRFLTPDADQYLSQLRLIAERVRPAEETWLSSLPGLDCMPIPYRRVDAAVLRTLISAIRERQAVEVRYQSMNPKRPAPIWRGISPHAFASDGLRWHVRAFCRLERKFKDFLLSRCLDCRKSGPTEADADEDLLWNELFTVELRPNPRLSEDQQEIIALDYAMDEGKLDLPIRKSLLFYFQKRLRLDVANALDNPQETPVVIANEREFNLALAEATEVDPISWTT
ncbi:WYL domain-containing protein [Aquisalimonas asiatica]|uniref:WYL domain-containing protein n=1 Tax=Aquisalimonas asiatica TaxID=406100 RepID=A0A1H8VRE4_9GAMM|nr:WYL domain-containing protein [Aquisalimonas asiatica]SEP17925.1 WYL domain-containing protein [Aquisalimonas asiatica]